MDYSKHEVCMDELKKSQAAEEDNRNMAREADNFVNTRGAQWETSIVNKMSGRPRYTFDMVSSIIDQIMGEFEGTDFDSDVIPADGEATDDIADVFDGLLMTIREDSESAEVFAAAARAMTTTGVDGWELLHDYIDEKSMDQTLKIAPVTNYLDRVWLDAAAERQDGGDARHGWKLIPMSPEEYEKKWPDGGRKSVSQNIGTNYYWDRPKTIVVGKFYFQDTKERTLVQLNDGRTFYEDDPEFEAVADDLALRGITPARQRKVETKVWKYRYFDADDWLEEASDPLPFNRVPLFPCYANFRVIENFIRYWGVVEKLIDPQRILNYAESRRIEEGALAPRGKYWMTEKQASGFTEKLRTLNTNAEPVQFYNFVEGEPAPWFQGSPTPNQSLSETSLNSRESINKIAGMFSSNMGDNPGLQSGVAIERQQDKGDNGTYKYFAAMKVSVRATFRTIIDAIPKVFDNERIGKLTKRNGTAEVVALNSMEFDAQTNRWVELNNLARGRYTVNCKMVPAFYNRQKATVDHILSLAEIDPNIIEEGGDVLLRNIQAPGMNELAERRRLRMVKAGLIPESQMDDDEKAMFAQAQSQKPQMSAIDQANLTLAQAEAEKAQAQVADTVSKVDERTRKGQLDYQKFMFDVQTTNQNLQMAMEKLISAIEKQGAEIENLKSGAFSKRAQGLKLLREALGADAVMSQPAALAFENGATRLALSQ